jgi:hypothetical protein
LCLCSALFFSFLNFFPLRIPLLLLLLLRLSLLLLLLLLLLRLLLLLFVVVIVVMVEVGPAPEADVLAVHAPVGLLGCLFVYFMMDRGEGVGGKACIFCYRA